jgi:tetratricopeptide (TPR) repeat protein
MENRFKEILSALNEQELQVFNEREAIKDCFMDMESITERTKTLEIVLNEMGYENWQAKRLDLAVRQYSLLRDLDPFDPEPHAQLGLIYLDLGEAKLAEEEAKKAVDLAPDNEDYIDVYFFALDAQDAYEKMLIESAKIINRRPLDAQSRAWYGHILNSLERYDEAIVALKGALVIDKNYSVARLFLADAFLGAEMYVLALRECAKVIKKEPMNMEAWETAGISFGILGNYDVAEKIFMKILKYKPDSKNTGYNLLQALNKQGIYSDYYLNNYEDHADMLLKIWRIENEVFKY